MNAFQTTPFTLLGIIFIVLKLTGVIAWSWWWVLAPFWVGLALSLGIVVICILMWLLVGRGSWARGKRNYGLGHERLY